MLRYIWTVVALLTAGVIYFLNLLFKKRRELDGLPQPPMSSRLQGHLPIAGEIIKQFPPQFHIHASLHYIRKKYGLGDYFYVDWWPLGPRWLFISDPELSSQYITTKQSLPKSPLETKYLNDFLGDQNMVTIEGAHWKAVRSIFNPGFSASHVMTLVPYIVDASLIFCNVLHEKEKLNELFELEEYATRLTIDIIGKVVLDSDFDSQKATHPIVQTFRERVLLLPPSNMPFQFDLSIIRRIQLWRNGKKLDRLIADELDRKLAARKAANGANGSGAPRSFQERNRSVVDLALDAYQKESKGSVVTGNTINNAFRRMAVDSFKAFIFAGHDTTASTIAYIFYLLHFHPESHKRVISELDSVFGFSATATETARQIKEDPHIINRLEYTTAVIKETLRLFPPASTLRYMPATNDPSKDLYFTDTKTGAKCPISGFHVWAPPHMIGRNEAYFPEPLQFIPERFIPSLTPFPEAKLFTPSGKDAWRPFEKGPRNCIGQELAMIESKVILALTVRDFDFVAEFGGKMVERWEPIDTSLEFQDGKKGKERLTIEGNPAYQILKGAAKPRDGMPGRIRLRNSTK